MTTSPSVTDFIIAGLRTADLLANPIVTSNPPCSVSCPNALVDVAAISLLLLLWLLSGRSRPRKPPAPVRPSKKARPDQKLERGLASMMQRQHVQGQVGLADESNRPTDRATVVRLIDKGSPVKQDAVLPVACPPTNSSRLMKG
jgi:hypothetical protein